MKGRPSVLVVEDEMDLADVVCYHLEREGYTCRRAEDGERAIAEAFRQTPDLIILDRMLPKVSGDDVVMRLKRDSRTAATPVIMLTAKAEDDDELVGFALGADDYIRKPFSTKLLVARVAALMRRMSVDAPQAEVLSEGPIILDHGRHEVVVDGRRLDLTATEFRVLACLMAAKGRVLSREQLIDTALGVGAAVTNRAMDVHIAALRKKLGDAAPFVCTIRGVGYAFRAPESESPET